MNVVEVVETVDEILNLNIKNEIDNSSVSKSEVLEQNPQSVSLLSCCNFVLEELYRDHAANCSKTVVEAAEGFINTKPLNMCRALTLADSSGNFVPFKYAEGGLRVKRDGRYNLTYAKLPAELTMQSDIVMPNSRITFRIFIYGVIAEYFERLGDYAQSGVWRDKYNAAISVATAASPCASMPVRRWL